MSETAKDKQVWWKTQRSKQIINICAGLFVVGLLVWFFHFRPYVSTDDARIATTVVRLAPQGMAGRVEKINVTEGAIVKKGDILVELDHRTANAQLERAQARVQLSQHELSRAEQLSAQNGLPARELDKIRAETQSAHAEELLAEVALDNTYLKSPMDGVVVQKIAEEGNILEPGQTALSIADLDHAWINANIEETAVGELKPGQPVNVTVDEGGTLSGKVLEIRSAAAAQFALIPSDNAAGNFTKLVQRIPIKIALDAHPDHPLRVGQSVEIRIRVK